MVASEEWWEYHLTPEGWVDGDCKLDFGETQQRSVPKDRLLTVRKTEVISSPYSRCEATWTEVYRAAEEERVKQLIDRYGSQPYR